MAKELKEVKYMILAIYIPIVCLTIAFCEIESDLNSIVDMQKDILQMETEMVVTQDDVVTQEYMGDFTITHYCTCEKCCRKSDGITASGNVATPHKTVAADTNIFPMGTVLNINGQLYTVEDRGGAIKGNRIDICVESHEEAIRLGKYVAEVYKVNV